MWRKGCAVALLVGLGGPPAFALTDEEIFRDFRFNLINPGARSLALGGAFISLADDATAAQANPAGLSYLLRREYFVELRGVDNGGQVTDSRESLPTGITNAVASGTNLDDVSSISFASFVMPVGRLTLGFSLQEILNSESASISSFSLTFPNPPGVFSAEGSGFIDVRQTQFNASVGFRVNDRLAFGGSLSASKLQVDSEVENFVVDTDGSVTGTPIPTPTLDIRTRISDDDGSFGVSLGAIVRPTEALSFGAVLRRAPKFSVTESIEPGIDAFGVIARLGEDFPNEFNTPDSYGVGGSWKPLESLTFALDVERIEYGDLIDGFVPGVNVLTGPDAEFTVDDATDVRLGGEWVVFLRAGVPLALRGGVFTQSENAIRAIQTGQKSVASGNIPFSTKESFPGRDREIHGAAGFGLVWNRFKLDLGFDVARSDNEVVLSLIVQGE